MNCDILPLSVSFSVSHSLFTSRSIDYWNTLRSLPFVTRPRSFSPLSLSLPLSFARLPCSLSSPYCPLSCTIHLANLIFGVDRALNRGLCFHIHLSPSPNLSFLSHSPSPFLFPLPLFFRVTIMKSGSSPSSVLAAFAGLRETNCLLILCPWFVKLTFA